MADGVDGNIGPKARAVLASAGFSTEAPSYGRLLLGIENLLRRERELVLYTNMEHRDDWADSPDCVAFSTGLAKKFLDLWAK